MTAPSTLREVRAMLYYGQPQEWLPGWSAEMLVCRRRTLFSRRCQQAYCAYQSSRSDCEQSKQHASAGSAGR